MRLFILGCLISCLLSSNARAAETELNEHMLNAYRMLLADPNRALQGYNLSSYFTKDIDYGNLKGAIKATPAIRAKDKDGNFSEPAATHKTMCNAAVTETIVEAVNSYASAHPNWSPSSVIPVESWNKKGFAGLKSHLFTEDLTDYPPIEDAKEKAKRENRKFEIPKSLLAEIRDFQSQDGMAFALEKFGIGKRVDFKNAKPGDIVTFDRESGSGHSVVFLGFLDRNQDVVSSYDAGKVIGFKYFSSQGGAAKGAGGLSERWAYFGGICPVRPNTSANSCKDRDDNAANRAKGVIEKPGKTPTDCCLNSAADKYGPRVGRLYSPESWTYQAAQPEMQKKLDALMTRIREFLKAREAATERFILLSKGAVAIEAAAPSTAKRFIENVQLQLGVDVRAVVKGDVVPSVSPQQVNALIRETPRAIISAANRQVTTEVKTELEQRIQSKTDNAVARLESGEDGPIPNPKMDSSRIDD